MMKFEDLNFSELEESPIELSADEFISETKTLLKLLEKAYAQCWYNRSLYEDEFPDETICNNCTGEGTFGEGRNCVKDREAGWCYERDFNANEFYNEVEDIMYQQDIFLKLLSCQVK